MANPVMNRIDNSIAQRTPAGYPTMPGYQFGAAQNGYAPSGQQGYQNGYAPSGQQGYSDPAWGSVGQTSPADPYSQPQPVDPRFLEQQYQAPAADAVDRGIVTFDDIFMRTGQLFAALLVAAVGGWTVSSINPALGALVSLASGITAFVLVLINTFKQPPNPALIVAYAVAEGVLLGGFSAVMEFKYPGIVSQAVIATVAVFTVMLLLFRSGKVRNSPKLQRIVLVGILGLIAYRLLSMLLSYTGVTGDFDYLTIAGIPLGVIVGVIAVVLCSFALIGDFDTAQRAVAAQAPKIVAWQVAFGLMVTIVWLYVEIIRILAIIRDFTDN